MDGPLAVFAPKPSAARRPGLAGRRVRSFILVEVLVAMTILGIALTAVLRSYTNALRSLSRDRRMATAVFLAQGLIEDFEIERPEDEAVEGDFGEDFPGFRYVARFEEEEIRYRDLDVGLKRRKFPPLCKVEMEIYYDAPGRSESVRVIHAETYLTGIEKYAPETKLFNVLY